MNRASSREGDLYRMIKIEKFTFEILYGYYEDSERDKVEPLPVFPDLAKNPIYTADSRPIVTAVQQPCEYYISVNGKSSEEWCGDCIYYLNADNEISICGCTERMLE